MNKTFDKAKQNTPFYSTDLVRSSHPRTLLLATFVLVSKSRRNSPWMDLRGDVTGAPRELGASCPREWNDGCERGNENVAREKGGTSTPRLRFFGDLAQDLAAVNPLRLDPAPVIA